MHPKASCLRNSKIALKFQYAKRIWVIDQNVQNIVLINNKIRLGLQKSNAIFEFQTVCFIVHVSLFKTVLIIWKLCQNMLNFDLGYSSPLSTFAIIL